MARGHALFLLPAAVALTTVAAADLPIDIANGKGIAFDGLGGLSGGGSTTRLLVDYPEPQRSQILDYLFKPNFGASLQMLKVEIGGDSQSTDGTETSHMHSADDLDYHRGYEWWLLTEAKKRNPSIKTYGLPWANPGWVGGPEQSGSPFTHPNLTSTYIMKWMQGAKDVYGIDIDYIGIWNERSSDATYAKTLRQTLDDAGFTSTQLVAKDGGADICNDLAADPEYAKAISIIGLHYPSDFSNYSVCHALGKPIWASEESSSYDDANGAACWARVVTSHYVLNGMTASIMWNLVGSYYHGTNWYASSMLTAVQPWSGYYEPDMPVVWATAHITQFTEVGWKFLQVGQGSGELDNGGYYATYVGDKDFTLTVVKISRDHASCTRPKLPDFNVSAETVSFKLSGASDVKELYVWHSNFEVADPTYFESKGTIPVAADGTFSLDVAVGDFYTVTTMSTGQKGTFGKATPSVPQFPLPYTDNFDSYNESSEAKYWTDQIGAWEIHPSADGSGNYVLKQMVPEKPIGWSDHGSNGPVSQLGMREFRDVAITAKFRLPSSAPSNASGCVGNRIDQEWHNGVVFCVTAAGTWTLSYGGPALGGVYTPSSVIKTGTTAPVPVGQWHELSLTTTNSSASASCDGKSVLSDVVIRNIDSGFSAIGASSWFAIEFDEPSIKATGSAWSAPVYPDDAFVAGSALSARECTPNGVVDPAQAFNLKPDWLLEHVASGLCAEAAAGDNAEVTLQPCQHGKHEQQFRNDYTRIRNGMAAVTLGAYDPSVSKPPPLVGGTDGTVSVTSSPGKGTWNQWVYFPNTQQLRNQYVANTQLGAPMCLTVSS